jgi:hypothetical protein
MQVRCPRPVRNSRASRKAERAYGIVGDPAAPGGRPHASLENALVALPPTLTERRPAAGRCGSSRSQRPRSGSQGG